MTISVAEMTPKETWDALQADPSAVLVDVRSPIERKLVGECDLTGLGQEPVAVELMSILNGTPNPTFSEDLTAALGGSNPDRIFFLCKTGGRSMKAAQIFDAYTTQNGRSVACINVAFGFEGEQNARGQRGTVNGWKSANLPWRQS